MFCTSSKRPRFAQNLSVRALLPIMLLAGCNDAGSVDGDDLDAAVTADSSVRTDARSDLMDASTLLDASAFFPLVDNRGWFRYDASLDPLPSHQPAQITCQESATYVEYGSYEVDTTRCNYLLAESPALRALPVGSDVRLSLLHYDLLAPAPASAHVALLFGDTLQWETQLPIPSPGDAVKASFKTRSPLALGEPIRLHLHNHGGNTYLLVALEAAE